MQGGPRLGFGEHVGVLLLFGYFALGAVRPVALFSNELLTFIASVHGLRCRASRSGWMSSICIYLDGGVASPRVGRSRDFHY